MSQQEFRPRYDPLPVPPLRVPGGSTAVIALACVVMALQVLAFVIALRSATQGTGVPAPMVEGIVLVAMALALWGWIEIVREIHVAQRQWLSSADATAPPA